MLETRIGLFMAFVILSLAPTGIATPQDKPTPIPRRDPLAVATAQKSFAALGGIAPRDISLAGRIVIEAGGTREEGTYKALLLGLSDSTVEISVGSRKSTLVVSDGRAVQKANGSEEEMSTELVVSTKSTTSPVVALAAALTNPDIAFEYLGTKSFRGTEVQRIRFWDTFASNEKLRHLAEFSARELWVDGASGLPVRLAYELRNAGGAVSGTPVEEFYADYRNVNGILFPFRVEKTLNGTPWAWISVEQVTVNSGLKTSDFEIR